VASRRTSDAAATQREFMANLYVRRGLTLTHGEGVELVSDTGERYLDLMSNYGVNILGYGHPGLEAALIAQLRALPTLHCSFVNDVRASASAELARRVNPADPGLVYWSNSGAEAVEAAVKLARVATGRPAIIAFRYGFHGRTAQTMALTAAKDVYRGAFEPLPGSIYHASYPYCYRAAGGAHDPADCTCDWEAQLDLLFHQLVFPDRVAAIIVEPVIGEGGYLVPPPGFLPRLREITRQHGILLIADEVQTGFGRTGEIFAVRHWDVEPDILVMAKGIASGLPLSGILAQKSIMDRMPPGSHGGTYGGNVVSCAAAMATLDVIEDEGLVENARVRGRQLLDGLRRITAGRASVGDVRGLGLMVALEFVKAGEGDGRVPDPALTKSVQQACYDRGLLLLTAGTYVNVIRIIPPLVTTGEEVDLALGIIAEALDAAGA